MALPDLLERLCQLRGFCQAETLDPGDIFWIGGSRISQPRVWGVSNSIIDQSLITVWGVLDGGFVSD